MFVQLNFAAVKMKLLVTLLRYGLWQSTPKYPRLAIRVELLRWLVGLMMESQISVKGFCESLKAMLPKHQEVLVPPQIQLKNLDIFCIKRRHSLVSTKIWMTEHSVLPALRCHTDFFRTMPTSSWCEKSPLARAGTPKSMTGTSFSHRLKWIVLLNPTRQQKSVQKWIAVTSKLPRISQRSCRKLRCLDRVVGNCVVWIDMQTWFSKVLLQSQTW